MRRIWIGILILLLARLGTLNKLVLLSISFLIYEVKTNVKQKTWLFSKWNYRLKWVEQCLIPVISSPLCLSVRRCLPRVAWTKPHVPEITEQKWCSGLLNWLPFVFFTVTAISPGGNEREEVWWVCSSDTEILEEVRGPEEIRPNEGRRYFHHFVSCFWQTSRISLSLGESYKFIVLRMSYVVCEKPCIPSEFLCVSMSLLFRGPDPPPFSASWTCSLRPPAEQEGEEEKQHQQELHRGLHRDGGAPRTPAVRGQEGEDRFCRHSDQVRQEVQGTRCPPESPSRFLSCKTNSFCFSYYQNRTCSL